MKFYILESALPYEGAEASAVTRIENEDANIAENNAFMTYHQICASKRADTNVKQHVCTITNEYGAQIISEFYDKSPVVVEGE